MTSVRREEEIVVAWRNGLQVVGIRPPNDFLRLRRVLVFLQGPDYLARRAVRWQTIIDPCSCLVRACVRRLWPVKPPQLGWHIQKILANPDTDKPLPKLWHPP
jgi:hypothetical protein